MSAYADQLRAVADFVDQHTPAAPVHVTPGSVSLHLTRMPDWRAEATRLQAVLGGDWTAKAMDDFVALEADTVLGRTVLFLPRYQAPVDALEVDVTDLIGAPS